MLMPILDMEPAKQPSYLLLCAALREARIQLQAAQHLAPEGINCHVENIANQLAVLIATIAPDPRVPDR
jgi:hypothetical protein